MNYQTEEILGYIVVVPFLIGLKKYKKTIRDFRPFIILLIFSTISEGAISIADHLFNTDLRILNYNLIVESFLVVWQFSNWSQSVRRKSKLLIFFLTLVWIYDNWFFNPKFHFDALFAVVYCLISIGLSLNQLSFWAQFEKGPALKSSKFLICFAFLIYFSYEFFIELFYLHSGSRSSPFLEKLQDIMVYINLLMNLIFIAAAIWMPTKRRYLSIS